MIYEDRLIPPDCEIRVWRQGFLTKASDQNYWNLFDKTLGVKLKWETQGYGSVIVKYAALDKDPDVRVWYVLYNENMWILAINASPKTDLTSLGL